MIDLPRWCRASALVATLLLGCEPTRASSPHAPLSAGAALSARPPASAGPAAPPPAAPGPASPAVAEAPLPSPRPLQERLAPVAACVAPSLLLHEPRDWIDAVPDCASLGPIVGGTDPRSCGAVRPGGGLARIDEAAPLVDRSTSARIAEIAKRGRAVGRNARAFGLVGDSITEGLLFLGPFTAGATQPVELMDSVASGLATTLDAHPASILDVYRGVAVERLTGFSRDSFRATRAARVGAPSGWALAPANDGKSPLTAMIERVNPAVALVMYGSNDAAVGWVEIDVLTARFEANLRRIVRELDAAGIIPILSTIPRRGPQDDLRDCAPEGLSDARIMVQTSALSAVAARVACDERLPLIDLRHAFDGLVSAGLFSDGIHPTSHPRGSGLLTEAGLGCGYNVRNYLALRMLRNVRQDLLEDAWR